MSPRGNGGPGGMRPTPGPVEGGAQLTSLARQVRPSGCTEEQGGGPWPVASVMGPCGGPRSRSGLWWDPWPRGSIHRVRGSPCCHGRGRREMGDAWPPQMQNCLPDKGRAPCPPPPPPGWPTVCPPGLLPSDPRAALLPGVGGLCPALSPSSLPPPPESGPRQIPCLRRRWQSMGFGRKAGRDTGRGRVSWAPVAARAGAQPRWAGSQGGPGLPHDPAQARALPRAASPAVARDTPQPWACGSRWGPEFGEGAGPEGGPPHQTGYGLGR